MQFEYLLPAGQVFRNAGAALIAVSNDGRHFAYNTTQGVFLRPFDALDSRVISGAERSLAPFFSPDGDTIAYFEGRTLMRRRIAGGAALTIGWVY